MDEALRLAVAATVAERCVAAVRNDAEPGDGTAEGALLSDVVAFTENAVGAETLHRTCELVQEQAPAQPDVLLLWAEPVHQALLSSRPLPASLREIRREVDLASDGSPADDLDQRGKEVFARLAVLQAAEAQRRGDWDTAGMWLRLHARSGWEGAAPRPRDRRRRRAIIGAALVLPVALVAGLVVLLQGPDGPELPYSPHAYGPVCRGEKYRDAPAYSGAAPHDTVVLMVTGNQAEPIPTFTDDSGPKFSGAWSPDEPSTVQAVACVEPTRRTGTVERCPYRTGQGGIGARPAEIPMVRTDYTITLIEARTGRRLHRVQVPGERAECPASVPVGTSRLDTEPTDQQYITALGRFIDG